MHNGTRRALLFSLAGAGAVATGRARANDRCGPVSAEQAIAIARSVGLVRVTEVECDDGEWEVEGYDARGREIEVEIDSRTGRITDVERD